MSLDVYLFCPQCKSSLETKIIDYEERKVCPSCGFIFWNNPKPVVSIILHKDGKVLMLQRAHEPFKDYWVLPGGFIGYSETAQEAIEREAKEETGLNVSLENITGVYRIDNDSRGIHIDIIFSAKANGEVIISSEDTQFAFFSPHQLPDKIAYKHREAIEDWFGK